MGASLVTGSKCGADILLSFKKQAVISFVLACLLLCNRRYCLSCQNSRHFCHTVMTKLPFGEMGTVLGCERVLPFISNCYQAHPFRGVSYRA